ncbi:MAG: hypothetical protein AAF916_00555 [Planctomycetota bacterium]
MFRVQFLTATLCSAVVSVLLVGAASAQIEYLNRNSFVGYVETDFDLLTNQQTFNIGDSAGTLTLDTFNAFVGVPGQSPLFTDTASGQLSQLFSNGIRFDSRVYAEEDRTDNAFGVYDAAAISSFTVDFRVPEDRGFAVFGDRFDASSGSRPGTTSFSLSGPGVSITETSQPISDGGTFLAGETYSIDVTIESIGQYSDDFLGVNRTRGEDVGFNFDLLLIEVDFIVGDYNENGQVEQGDLNLVLNNWGQPRAFDDPGGGPFTTPNVDQEELNRVLNNWGSGDAPSFSGFAVPEPALGVALLAAGLLMKRKKPTD